MDVYEIYARAICDVMRKKAIGKVEVMHYHELDKLVVQVHTYVQGRIVVVEVSADNITKTIVDGWGAIYVADKLLEDYKRAVYKMFFR